MSETESPVTARPKKRWLKRLVIAAGILTAVVVVLLIAAPSIVSSSWGRAQITSAAGNAMAGSVKIDSLSLSWFGAQTVKGVALNDPAGQSVVSVEEVRVEASLFSLATGGRDLGKVVIKGLVANVEADEEGKTNIQDAVAPTTPSQPQTTQPAQPIQLPVSGTIEIVDAQLHVTKPGIEPVTIDEVNVTAALPLGGPIDINLKARPRQGRLTGNVAVDATVGGFDDAGTLRPAAMTLSGMAKVTDLPVDGIDTLLSMKGVLRAALGDQLDIDMVTHRNPDGTQAVQIAAGSANLVVKSESAISDAGMLQGNARVSFKATPAFVAALGKGSPNAMRLNQPTLVELNVDKVTAPITGFDPASIAMNGSLTVTDGWVTSPDDRVGRIGWQNVQATFASTNLAQRITVKAAADTEAGGKEGSVRIDAVLARLFDAQGKPQVERADIDAAAKLTSLPVALADALAQQKGLMVDVLGSELDLDVRAKTTGIGTTQVTLSAASPNLSTSDVKLMLTDRVQLAEPATVDLQVAKPVLARYLPKEGGLAISAIDSPLIPVRLTLEQFAMPMPAEGQPAVQPAKTTAKATLALGHVRVTGLPEAGPLSARGIRARFEATPLTQPQVLVEATVDDGGQGLVTEALGGATAFKLTALTAVDDQLQPGAIEFALRTDSRRLALGEQQVLRGSISSDFSKLTFRPGTMRCMLTPGLLAQLRAAKEGQPQLAAPAALTLNIKELALPLTGGLRGAMVKADGALTDVRIKDVPEFGVVAMDRVPLSIDLNGAANTLNASLNATPALALNGQPVQGKVAVTADLRELFTAEGGFNSTAPGKVIAEVGDLPSALVGALVGEAELVGLALGPMINLTATYHDDRAQPTRFDVVAKTQQLELNVQLAAVANGFVAPQPATLRLTVSPALFTALTRDEDGRSNMLLVQPILLHGTISKLTLPMSAGSVKLSDAVLDAKFTVSDGQFRQAAGGPEIWVSNTTITAVTDPWDQGLKLKAVVNADVLRQGMEPGKLAVTAALTNLVTPDGAANVDGMNADVKIDATQMPVALLDELGGFDGLLTAALGQTLKLEATAKLTRMAGPVKASLQADNVRADLHAQLADDYLALNEDATAQFTVTEELSRKLINHPLLKQAVKSEQPVTVRAYRSAAVALDGPVQEMAFRLPIRPFDLLKLQVPKLTIDPGKMTVKNAGLIRTMIDLPQRLSRATRGRRTQRNEGDEMIASFTPLDLTIVDGVAKYSRMDMLLSSDYQIATWGVMNLSEQPRKVGQRVLAAGQGRMILGLSERAMRRVYGVSLYRDQPDYVDQFVMQGPINTLSPDMKDMTARLTLLTGASATGGGGDGILQIATQADRLLRQATNQRRDWEAPPPAYTPLPWPEEVKPAEPQQDTQQPKQAAPTQKDKPKDKTQEAIKEGLKALEGIFGK